MSGRRAGDASAPAFASASASASAGVTISSESLFLMRRMADAPVFTRSVAEETEAALRESRHAASKARAGRWPNTLEGLRKRKDQARVDRAEAIEAENRVRDGEEARARDAARDAILDTARAFVEEQSEKMKVLRNFRSRVRDQEVLLEQAALKAELQGERRREEEEAHAAMLAELARAHDEEAGKAEAMRAKARALQQEQQATLRSVIERRIAEMAETEEAGRRSLAEIAERNRVAFDAAIMRRDQGLLKNKEFQAENARLKAMREELKKSEAEALVWIAQQAAAKEAKDAQIKAIIARGRAEAEKKAKLISDVMYKDLMGRKNSEDARLSNEVAKADAKEAARLSERLQRQQEMRESIAADIRLVKERIIQSYRDRAAEDQRDDVVFRGKLAAMEAAESEARERAREVAMRYKKEAVETAAQRAAAAAAARAALLGAERAAMAKLASGDDDAGFRAESDRIRAEEQRKGHSLQTFERLVYKTLNRPLQSNS